MELAKASHTLQPWSKPPTTARRRRTLQYDDAAQDITDINYSPTRPPSQRNHGRPQNNHRPVLRTSTDPFRAIHRLSANAPLTHTFKVLAIGFLLVILSSALWHNYLPLLVVATYVIAPVPNWVCGHAQSSDDFMDGGSSAVVELGRFLTGFLVVMGVGKRQSHYPYIICVMLIVFQHFLLSWHILVKSPCRPLPCR